MPEAIPAWELESIMTLYKEHRSKGVSMKPACMKVGEIMGRHWQVIYAVVKRLTPTTGVAADYIKASAYKMAKRLVKEARAPELIDVLSRPNMGVLAPKQEGGGSGGFFLSVTAESCGAVKIGVTNVPQALESGQKALAQGYDTEEGAEDASGGGREGDEGLQVIDVHPQDPSPVAKPSPAYMSNEREALITNTKRHGLGHIGQSKTYMEAVERAKAKIEDARMRGIQIQRHNPIKSPCGRKKKSDLARKQAENEHKQAESTPE